MPKRKPRTIRIRNMNGNQYAHFCRSLSPTDNKALYNWHRKSIKAMFEQMAKVIRKGI